MKKILFILLISFIAKPDYSGVDLRVGTDGDVDLIGIGYRQVNSKLSFGVALGRAEYGSISGTVSGVDLAYAFTDFNTGSFYVDLAYSNVDVLGISVSDTNFGLGYAKAAGDGLDYDVGISDSEAGTVFSAGLTNWLDNGLGIGAAFAVDDFDTAVAVNLIYKF